MVVEGLPTDWTEGDYKHKAWEHFRFIVDHVFIYVFFPQLLLFRHGTPLALEFSWLLLFRHRAWMISHLMIQFGKIAEVMFRLLSHLDYDWSCSVKSPNGSVKLEYFPHCFCLWMALQEYKAGYPTHRGGIHPDSCQALDHLLLKYY